MKSKFSAFLSGFLLGSLTGGAVALLLAPQSGEDTRVLLKDRGTEFQKKAITTVEDTRVKAEEAVQQTKERASEFSQRGQEVITEQRHRFENILENIKQSKLEKLAALNCEEEELIAEV